MTGAGRKTLSLPKKPSVTQAETAPRAKAGAVARAPAGKPAAKAFGPKPGGKPSGRGSEAKPWAKSAAPKPADARPGAKSPAPRPATKSASPRFVPVVRDGRPYEERKRTTKHAVAEPAPDSGAEPAVARPAPTGVRVSKLMAEQGLCSRREADDFIGRGWVFVDGQRVAELGTRVDPSARITLSGEARAQQTRQVTILLHKPVGYVSGQPEPGCVPAVTLIQPENQYTTPDTPLFHPSHLQWLAPAGRLDIDSTGLLVMTQDGRVARQLIGDDSSVDKEYLVRVDGSLSPDGLAKLNHGLWLDGKELRPAKVEWLNEDQLRFVLREGKKRQIRRMCEMVGLKVVGLKRVRIGGVKLGDLPLGKWRYLREDEKF